MNSDLVQGKEALLNFQRLQVPRGWGYWFVFFTHITHVGVCTKIILSSHYQNEY